VFLLPKAQITSLLFTIFASIRVKYGRKEWHRAAGGEAEGAPDGKTVFPRIGAGRRHYLFLLTNIKSGKRKTNAMSEKRRPEIVPKAKSNQKISPGPS